jgi:hypothetical protein
MAFSNEQKMKCAERELAKRVQVYPKLVAKGRMSPNKRDYELAIMEEIAADYRASAERDQQKAEREQADKDLFRRV